jgi:hypothetical protein
MTNLVIGGGRVIGDDGGCIPPIFPKPSTFPLPFPPSVPIARVTLPLRPVA